MKGIYPESRKKQTGMHIQSLHLLHDTFPARNCYPFNLEIFQKTDKLEFLQPVTFFIGENGTENQPCSGLSPASATSISGKSMREAGTAATRMKNCCISPS
jgi:predicted ATPase